MWWDEMYSAVQASMSGRELIQNLFEDRVHLPLYPFLLIPWSEMGLSAFILRYFSVIWGVLGVALIYRTGRLLSGASVGLLAAGLLAISPFHIWFSQEARMYTFLAFNALLATWFLLRQFRRETRRNWIGYAAAMTFTMYSHYLGTLVLIAHYTFFSLHYRRHKQLFRRWFMAGSVAGLLFVGWFLTVFFVSSFTQASISWIETAQWYEPLLSLFSFCIGPSIDPTSALPYLAFLVYLAGFGAAALFLLRDKKREASPVETLSARLLFLGVGVPFILVTLVSLDWPIPQQRSVYMDRYLTSTLPLYILLVAWGWSKLQQHPWAPRWLPAILLAGILLPTFSTWQNMYFDPAYQRENWRGAFAYVEANWQEDDVLLLKPGQILPFFYQTDGSLPYEVLPSSRQFEEDEEEEREEKMRRALQAQMDELGSGFDRVWVMQGYDNANPHGFPQRRNQKLRSGELNRYESWLRARYPLVEEWTDTGVRLGLYRLD
jgi:uncharacterized membrane protein